MTTLFQAMNTQTTTTENGMPTLQTSLHDCVDLFFKVGASRGKDITGLFSKAFVSDSEIAARIALWARDVRGGAGERQLFRDMVNYMVSKDLATAEKVLAKIPEVGRWDDVLILFGTKLENQALRLIATALKDGNGLCAKWMPRKGDQAKKLRAYLKMSPKEYRKLLVGLTNVVESKMCAKEWDSIEFGKLPSLASARYQKAFDRNAPVAYGAYKDALESGEAKINAGAVYPYDVIKSLKMGDQKVANAQWAALPDYVAGNTENYLCLVDVSSSMDCSASGNSMTCMDIAISLGLYLSERSRGVFCDQFITFDSNPQLFSLKGSLSDRYRQMKGSPWGGSTNLEKAFKLILDSAVKHKVAESEMPTSLIVLSDMQFNQCQGYGNEFSSYAMIDRMYADAGYKRPKIVYWNLRDSNGVPVTFDQAGTALVSGASPAIVKNVLAGKSCDPVSIMLEAIMVDRYQL
jgi:hypothetical protein